MLGSDFVHRYTPEGCTREDIIMRLIPISVILTYIIYRLQSGKSYIKGLYRFRKKFFYFVILYYMVSVCVCVSQRKTYSFL